MGILSEHPPSNTDLSDGEQRRLLSELSLGAVIDGKYRIQEVLGRGAMGVVVSATHLRLNERVAIKFLHTRAQGNGSGPDDFQSRFEREARVSARLRNEHITRVVDAGVWRERVPYMVMEYLTGTDLREVMKRKAPLPLELALDYAVQVCEGIAEAHANGVVHRDLKPPNLFITKRADGSDLVKILDFGISKWTARDAEVTDLTETGVVLGSPKYMAPEQLFGAADVDARADLWSIGAIVYEMLAGRAAFDFPTFSRICAELSTDRMPPSLCEVRPEIPEALDAAVMRCFARSPDARHRDVAELAGALLDAVESPSAASTRHRIASTLGRRDAAEPQVGPSGALSGSGLLTSGSLSSKRIVVGARSGSAPSTTPNPDKRVPGSVWLVAAAGVLGLSAAGWFVAGRHVTERRAGAPAVTPATPNRVDMAPPATASAVGELSPGTVTASEPSSGHVPTGANSVEPTPSLERPTTTSGRGPVRPRGHSTGAGAPPATSATVLVATPPQPTVVATPPTSTAPAVKSDPLGDRQ